MSEGARKRSQQSNRSFARSDDDVGFPARRCASGSRIAELRASGNRAPDDRRNDERTCPRAESAIQQIVREE
jgi:hypothetical protein